MTQQKLLTNLIKNLQELIELGEMSRVKIATATRDLSMLGYEYDVNQYPNLVNTETYTDLSGDSPSNLAEALLWKLGKWKSYKQFVADYVADDSKPTKTNVVFWAFARHLKDNDNPIYDQHTIRAIWAICNLSDDEKAKCRLLLFDNKDKWKPSGSGGETIECYKLFFHHVKNLVNKSDGATLKEFDHLLMPLGQAIKKFTSNYSEFCALCGWSNTK